ncbi:transcription factor HHO2-like [Henckelia pumila]|uniref:transcription factor HHO2-like n=1 Tax=Henckelia pumila TaxID=405737 RepID=UPI003C6E01F1
MQRFQGYIQALEEERDKIQVFRRELPLCFELVTQAIESCKHQLSGTTTECNLRGQSECSEQTSCPVFEEFIPLKRASNSHSDGEEEDEESHKPNKDSVDISDIDGKIGNEKNSKKSDWLRSAQLWNQTTDSSSKEDSPRKVVVTEVTRGGAFQPFKKEKSLGTSGTSAAPPTQVLPKNKSPPPPSTSSTADTGGRDNKKEDKEGESLRKARRCWSPDLHRRFVQALHQLGGSHVATPKQIRELMKVDGLTNDEVKSHLQKYRLHTRSRPSPSVQNNNINSQQTPQVVVVGGIWVPVSEYATMATTTTSGDASGVAAPSGRIYAPIASVPQPFREAPASAYPQQRQLHSDDGGSLSGEGGVDGSHSPATSSSTHTTTASPSY